MSDQPTSRRRPDSEVYSGPPETWFKQREENARLARLDELKKIPLRYRECTIENWQGTFPELAADWNPASSWMLLVFGGDVGVGKTHVATAIWRRFVGKFKPALWWSTPALLDRIYEGFERGDAGKLVTRVSQCGLLLLDDFGTKAVDDAGEKAQARFARIMLHRYEHKLPTIMTTNRLQAEIEEWYPAIADRVYASDVTMVGRVGASWRKKRNLQ